MTKIRQFSVHQTVLLFSKNLRCRPYDVEPYRREFSNLKILNANPNRVVPYFQGINKIISIAQTRDGNKLNRIQNVIVGPLVKL